MKNRITVCLYMLLISAGLLAQTPPKMQKTDYEARWEEVEKANNDGLPKSAYDLSKKIFDAAKREKNDEQVIIALLHCLKYQQDIGTAEYHALLTQWEREMKSASFPASAVMHSMLAKMYGDYYNSNQWTINERTNTSSFVNDSIETWTSADFARKIILECSLSLKQAGELQKIPLSRIQKLLYGSTENAKNLRPTLFDFLVNENISHLSNYKPAVEKPTYAFELDNDALLLPAKEFVAMKTDSRDSLSFDLQVVRLYQQWLQFRMQDSEKSALLFADAQRLELYHNSSLSDSKDSAYVNTLLQLQRENVGGDGCSYLKYLEAQFHVQQAAKFRAGDASTQAFQWEYKRALDLCQRAVKEFDMDYGAALCRDLIRQIEAKQIELTLEDIVAPNQRFAMKVSFRNIGQLSYRIMQMNANKFPKQWMNDAERIRIVLEKGTLIAQGSEKLPTVGDYAQHAADVLLEALPVGSYYLIYSENADFAVQQNIISMNFIQVSALGYFIRSEKDSKSSLYVFDRTTGQAVAGAKIETFYQKYKNNDYHTIKHAEYTTNVDGYASIVSHIADENVFENIGVKVSVKNDSLRFNAGEENYYSSNHDFVGGTIFTDRAIYRPGQTVFYKGVYYSPDGDTSKLMQKASVHVQFLDVNGQEIGSESLTTNQFGSFNGSFAIPQGILNGTMTLSTRFTSTNIQVEDYKRPKFTVELQQPKGIYLVNQKISVKGTAISFAGSVLSNAKASYKIERTVPYCHYWWYPQRPSKIISQGTLTTNEKGELTIDFVAQPDRSLPHLPEVSFQYKITLDVTDLNGETQSAEIMLTVGYSSFKIAANLPAKQDVREILAININTQNLNSQALPTSGMLRVYKLQDPKTALRKRLWEAGDTVVYGADDWAKRFAHNEFENETNPEKMSRLAMVYESSFKQVAQYQAVPENITKWQTGWYAVQVDATDSAGNKRTQTSYCLLFDSQAKTTPHAMPFWFHVPHTTLEPGVVAKVLLGTGHAMRVLYEVERDGKLLRSEWLQLNNEQRVLELPITEADRGGLQVSVTAFYDNRTYSQSVDLNIPWSNKALKLKFETFRDKLQPGQQEQWKISVRTPQDKPALAEFLTTLYDASLDEFVPHAWDGLSPFAYHQQRLAWQSIGFGTRNDNAQSYYTYSYYGHGMNHCSLNWYDFYYRSYPRYRMMKSGMAKRSVDYPEEEMVMEAAAPPMPSAMAMDKEIIAEAKKEVLTEVAKVGYGVPSSGLTGSVTNTQNTVKTKEPIKARTNLSELAFFYPNLYTDENGVVTVQFTIPEALTKWKMLGFAHTQDLSFGTIENTLQTQKELMVMPNPPRFLREGDTIEFPVKISNLTAKALKGEAQLQLFDALTQKPINQLLIDKPQKQNFSVDAQGNAVVFWKIAVPLGVEAITWRATADCGTFADGEENTLPVLSNRMLVTETMPMAMSHKGTKTFVFEKMKNNTSTTLRHRTYTLEFTSNPAWYAVQALPYLIEYPYECAEQTFSRFYANSIATHIVNSSPRVKAVFDRWASESDGKALLSKLEKNQDLKSILLQETPWVLESQDQTERQKRVALLFDLNRMSNELQSAIKKLQDMQFSEGGWPWFKGMKSDRYITEHIVCGIAHLQKLNVVTKESYPEIEQMLDRAVDYIDAEMEKEYRLMLREWPKQSIIENHLSWTDIHYLYTRSFFLKQKPVAKRYQEAFNYYLQQAEKYWLSHQRYAQGMIGLSLHRAGKKPSVDKIIASMREFALHSEEMGMYWKDNTGGWYWYQAPIETQALLIELFADATKDTVAVNDMKLWLLKQKQTQDWKTTKATTEAVYALLLQGDNWLNNTDLAKIRVGNLDIDPNKMDGSKPEAGTGYFRTSWSGGEITSDMATVTITNPNTSPAWGAMYWQYYEQLDKITAHETPLRLSKQLFIETQTDGGAVMRPLTDTSLLKVGDKIIVRIELRTDRDMEYLHLKDMRAAGFEPVNVLSGYKWQAGFGYYESTKDASTNFFIDYLAKGTYVFEYPLRVAQRGSFSNGITSIQCMYAPEFAGHSEGVRVEVK